VIPTAVKPLSWESFACGALDSLVSTDATPRYIGFIPYDHYARKVSKNYEWNDPHQRPMVFEIHQILNPTTLSPENLAHGNLNAVSLVQPKSFYADLKKLRQKWEAKSFGVTTPGTLIPESSDETYLDLAGNVIHQIHNGTFYQLNLLRYFRLKSRWSWLDALGRLQTFGGAYSCALKFGSVSLVSFSPERFIRICDDKPGEQKQIHTWPIKGTAPTISADALQLSAKDAAELSMITDLMRHDLGRVCEPGSISVPSDQESVHMPGICHLQSHVSGRLRKGLSFDALFESLMPAGSITGAPKIEVISHIGQLERRPRGFFMGHAFIVYANGDFDSSVLIRTLISKDQERSWHYAAGSGLVVKSDPVSELEEIKVKCSPIIGKPD
jgi:anthranilate/para-aminobenzoate synthase component I